MTYGFRQLFPQELEPDSNTSRNHILHYSGYTYAARRREFLNASRRIDYITPYADIVVKHIANIYANTKLHAFTVFDLRVEFIHCTLECNGTLNATPHTGKFGQYAVPRRVYYPAIMGSGEILKSQTMTIQSKAGMFLIPFHKTCITLHVSDEHRHQPAWRITHYHPRNLGACPRIGAVTRGSDFESFFPII